MFNVCYLSTFPTCDAYYCVWSQESEGEDAAETRVTLAEDVGRGNLASRQSRVKLQEVQACLLHEFCCVLLRCATERSTAQHAKRSSWAA